MALYMVIARTRFGTQSAEATARRTPGSPVTRASPSPETTHRPEANGP
jgi:hypothetical protein